MFSTSVRMFKIVARVGALDFEVFPFSRLDDGDIINLPGLSVCAFNPCTEGVTLRHKNLAFGPADWSVLLKIP